MLKADVLEIDLITKNTKIYMNNQKDKVQASSKLKNNKMSVVKKFRITKIKNSKPLISLKKISLSFKKNHLILDNISIDISKGQVIGLLGPNGAGKSSLMNLITGVIKPNYGNIIINNEDITQYPIYVRTKKFKIASVPQIGGFFADLSAEDNLNAVGEILIKDIKNRKLKIEELISKFELDAVRKVEAKFLSGGMKRRLVISMSLLGEPEILLMDEPLAALRSSNYSNASNNNNKTSVRI